MRYRLSVRSKGRGLTILESDSYEEMTEAAIQLVVHAGKYVSVILEDNGKIILRLGK